MDGLVVAEVLPVTPGGWADDVFDPSYWMRSIEELERTCAGIGTCRASRPKRA